jgi:hypothetical protein
MNDMKTSKAKSLKLRPLPASDLQRVGGGATVRVHDDTGFGNWISLSP